MYVSQVPATVIYTVFKTALLILFAKTIESICSWVGRYDAARVMEQGSYTVLFGWMFTKNYQSFMTPAMALILLIVTAAETVTNLLPTIATSYMPFQLVSFTTENGAYFYAIYDTPMQANRIPSINVSTSDPMQAYCNDMGVCENSQYNTNVLRISPTMQVKSIPYDYDTTRFITDFVNVTAPYCPSTDSNAFDTMKFGVSTGDLAGPYNFTMPNMSTEIFINLIETEESDTGAMTLTDLVYNFEVEHQINDTSNDFQEYINAWATARMLYRPSQTDIISVTHISSILYTNGQETVVLVLKVALHNLNSNGPSSSPNITIDDIGNSFGDTSAILYDASFKASDEFWENETTTTASTFTHYVENPYLSVDLVQRTSIRNKNTVMKVRVSVGVFVITDRMLPKSQPRYYDGSYMTNYNSTRNEYRSLSPNKFTMRQLGFYDQMFDGFNDAPTDDFFMYAILNSSNNTMYGLEGYQAVVADVSPIFLGLLCAVIFLMCVIFAASRYAKDQLYFQSLYQALGHVDATGKVGDTNNEIPRMSIKDQTIVIGDKVLLLMDDSIIEPLRSSTYDSY